jgi:hypothetical protein
MADYSEDFKAKVKTMANLPAEAALRECYGTSNSAKFVTGGFLCGIPNLDSLDNNCKALCVFSRVQLSPSSEFHSAVVIRDQVGPLLQRLSEMLLRQDDFYAEKNNNCALFLAPDGKIYAYNKAKVTFELSDDVLTKIGPGIVPEAFYWGIYGEKGTASVGYVGELSKLVGQEKLTEVASTSSMLLPGSPSQNAAPSPSAIEATLKDLVDKFLIDSHRAQLCLSASDVKRFIASLLSKRFLISTGLAGSGKTKLSQAFSRWITPKPGNEETTDIGKGGNTNEFYAMIAVGADWSSSENILGYPNGLIQEIYVTKPALDLILHANAFPDEPHFLILDEMNLSHVERYFSDILSAMESGETIPLHRDRERHGGQFAVPNDIQLPENLFIIGTVNVDETTYMFSPKVLDRANVIEFRMEPRELQRFLESPTRVEIQNIDGLGAVSFGKQLVAAAKVTAEIPSNGKAAFDAEMLLFFNVLQTYGSEFGYRVAYEAYRFTYFFLLVGSQGLHESLIAPAFDCVVVQKLLPKLHGSRSKLGPLLKSLWYLCVTPPERRGEDACNASLDAAHSSDSRTEPSTFLPADTLYPLAAHKISRMWRLLRDNGFTSFAEA